jgi:hypothetical protein
MSSRRMSLLPRATLHSDSEQTGTIAKITADNLEGTFVWEYDTLACPQMVVPRAPVVQRIDEGKH